MEVQSTGAGWNYCVRCCWPMWRTVSKWIHASSVAFTMASKQNVFQLNIYAVRRLSNSIYCFIALSCRRRCIKQTHESYSLRQCYHRRYRSHVTTNVFYLLVEFDKLVITEINKILRVSGRPTKHINWYVARKREVGRRRLCAAHCVKL